MSSATYRHANGEGGDLAADAIVSAAALADDATDASAASASAPDTSAADHAPRPRQNAPSAHHHSNAPHVVARLFMKARNQRWSNFVFLFIHSFVCCVEEEQA